MERLQPHAGKTALLTCVPMQLRLTVTAGGELSAAAADAVPDVAIHTTPGVLARVAAGDESAWSAARLEGDADFAASIEYVRRNVRWDYEEDLSRVFGDIAAHRLASGAQELQRWGRDAALNAGRAIVEYTTYENPLLASPAAVEAFNREVDILRDDAARLEKRLELIERRSRP
jgi:ubiquinone biosynthesis protein UbiJ